VKVFISWSGNRSEAVAKALKSLIEGVLPDAEGWLSYMSLMPGALWTPELLSQIAESSYGVLCLTSENAASPWILFEAGGLTASLQGRYVCPYLLDVSPRRLEKPLSLLNAATANNESTYALLKAINSQRKDQKPMQDRWLRSVFDNNWAMFNEELGRARQMTPDMVPLQELKADAVEGIARKLFEILETASRPDVVQKLQKAIVE
jgi:TIR domain